MTPNDEHLRGHVRRRQYDPIRRGGVRDVDQLARARMLRVLLWGAPAGFLMGMVAGFQLGHPLLGGFTGTAVAIGGALAIAEMGGRVGRTIYNPTGSGTPHKRDYSLAAALAVRGQYDQALEAYELAVKEHPEDPEPYLRIARLLRDQMGRPEDAARWFKRARTDATVSDGQALAIGRELVELYTTKLGDPAKAAPELARIADRHPGTREGTWAERELAELKRKMREGDDA